MNRPFGKRSWTVVAVAVASLINGLAQASSVLDGFNATTDGDVRAVALQTDGKILLGGAFGSVSAQSRANLARLNIDGSLDTTFAVDVDGAVESVLVQPNGKIVIGGDFAGVDGSARSHLARLNGDGSLDADFDPAPDAAVRAIALQFDGKILLGGDFAQVGQVTQAHLARLNADGSLDLRFDPDVDGSVHALAAATDGRLAIGGAFQTVAGQARPHLAVLTPLGTLDASCSSTLGTINGDVRSLALEVDGTLLAAGDFTQLGGSSAGRLSRISLQTCAVDSTYAPAADAAVHAIALQPDGKSVVTGSFSNIGGRPRSHAARLNRDGSADDSFVVRLDADATAARVQPDGSIVLGGSFAQVNGSGQAHVARVYPNGATDRDLNPTITSSNGPVAFTVGPDSRLFVLGDVTSVNGTTVGDVALLNADGSLDAGFSANAPLYTFASGNGAMFQGDGKILYAARAQLPDNPPLSGVFRLNSDGSPDSTFAPYSQNGGSFSTYQAIALNDGRVMVGGAFDEFAGQTRYALAAVDGINGVLDPSFEPAFIFDATDGQGVANFVVQDDGKLIIAGFFTQVGNAPNMHQYLARLNADGTLDESFDPQVDGFVLAVALDAEGSLLIAGGFTSIAGNPASFIARLNPDGSFDPGFNATMDGVASTLVPLANGDVLLGGQFAMVNGVAQSALARIHADGSLDMNFAPVVSGDFDGYFVLDVAAQADGKILTSGVDGSLAIDGEARPLIARLSADDAGIQSLDLSADHSRILWHRSGGLPAVDSVTFDLSADGVTWADFGAGVRSADGWSVASADLPVATAVWVRAQGYAISGRWNSGRSLMQSVQLFRLSDTYLVTPVALAHGSFDPAVPTSVAPGATVSFELVADPGYRIGQVSGCGGTLSGSTYVTAPAAADCAVTATFVSEGGLVVTPSAGAHGSIDPDTPQTVADGATTTFTLAPESGFVIDSVTGTCSGSLSGTVFTTAPITSDCTVVANFTDAPVADRVFADGFDDVSP